HHLDLHIPPTPPHATATHLHHTPPQIHHRVSTPSPYLGSAANATPPPRLSPEKVHNSRIWVFVLAVNHPEKGVLGSLHQQGTFGFCVLNTRFG
nr:hypothetical protein [Tanacetum cinerariifolium]